MAKKEKGTDLRGKGEAAVSKVWDTGLSQAQETEVKGCGETLYQAEGD